MNPFAERPSPEHGPKARTAPGGGPAAVTEPGAAGALGQTMLLLNLAGLALLAWGVVTELPPAGPRRAAAVALIVASVLAWLGWLGGRVAPGRWGRRTIAGPVLAVCLAVMAAAGGALATFEPVALVFPGVAAMAATITWPLATAAGIVVIGPGALLVGRAGAGDTLVYAVDGVAVALVGAIAGASRRDAHLRIAQAGRLEVEEARAEAERARAELLAGRNHLARELHDVLAHTLSALSLQLEALDALVAAGPSRAPQVREQLDGTRRLVREGLEEARGAVRALRDDLGPLEEQLAQLTESLGGTIEVTGTSRRLRPDVTLALYRVGQEALTNAVKHARTPAAVRLDFGDGRVDLTVTNAVPEDEPANGTGGGYGLQGIRERVLLVGGRVETGPTPQGWRVHAEVPA